MGRLVETLGGVGRQVTEVVGGKSGVWAGSRDCGRKTRSVGGQQRLWEENQKRGWVGDRVAGGQAEAHQCKTLGRVTKGVMLRRVSQV